jgi:hypothetical protein
MKKGLCCIILMIFSAAAFAVDFGLVLGTEGEYARALEPEGFSLTGFAGPWVSFVQNENLNFYASGKLGCDYAEDRDPRGNFFFELERTELNLRPVPFLFITLGRQRFQDPLGMAASGLFDGLNAAVNLDRGRFSLGAFYTGLLYKESAKILMTGDDVLRYEKPLDAPNLEGYFASRRVLLALTGDFPALLPGMGLTVQGLAQVDVNGTDAPLHSEYLEIRLAAEPLDPLHLDAGFVGELIQAPGGLHRSAGVSAGADWEVPGPLGDLLSAKFIWTGGRSGGEGRAFSPVGGVGGGRIFDPGLGALVSAGLSYQARLLAGLSAGAGAAYLIRTDTETFRDGDLDGASDSPLLGGELYGSLVWAPDPAVRLSAGGGAFFPGWGKAFRGDAPVRWKVNVGLIVSL